MSDIGRPIAVDRVYKNGYVVRGRLSVCCRQSTGLHVVAMCVGGDAIDQATLVVNGPQKGGCNNGTGTFRIRLRSSLGRDDSCVPRARGVGRRAELTHA